MKTDMPIKLHLSVIFQHIKRGSDKCASPMKRGSADTRRIYHSNSASWLHPNHIATIKLTKLEIEREKFISKLQV